MPKMWRVYEFRLPRLYGLRNSSTWIRVENKMNADTAVMQPRWIVRYRKGDLFFTAEFALFDEMLLSCARARASGYTAVISSIAR